MIHESRDDVSREWHDGGLSVVAWYSPRTPGVERLKTPVLFCNKDFQKGMVI